MNFAKMSYNWQTKLGQTGIWGRPEVYDSLYHFVASPNGHPAMENWHKENNECNYNFKGYIQISEDFKKDALDELKRKPDTYFKNVETGINIFFEPTEQMRFGFLETNAKKIKPIRRIYNWGYDYPPGEIGENLINLNKWFYILVFTLSSIVLYFYRKTFVAKIIFLIAFVCIYIFVVGNMFEINENNRFRFPTLPLVLILMAIQLQFIYQRIRNFLQD